DRSLAPQFDTVPGMKLAKIIINFHLNNVDSAQLTLPASRSIQHHLFRTEMDEHYKQRIVSYIEQQSKVIKD
ncbi:MAG: hypothetical protein JWQ30_533, partial [Sediminibacterium sp.]|nr:hypothetical protein [Sediminibacterium sp.]